MSNRLAQVTYTPLVGEIPGLVETAASGDFTQWISNMYVFLVGIAGVLAIVMIFVAGFEFVVSGDNAGKRSDAKKRIQAALGGLLLAVSSWLILNTINPQLVNIRLSFQRVEVPEGSGVVGGSSDPNASNFSGADSSNSFFFGGVGVDPYFVKHTDRSNPYWNYYHGNGSLPQAQQAASGVGVPQASPSNVGAGDTSGSITLSYFGGPIDVRINSGGYALQYCNNKYGGQVGDFVETTTVGSTTYRWCYALDGSENKISFPGGRRSAHGGYFETAAVSGERFSAMNPGSLYVAYPINKALSGLPSTSGLKNQNTVLKRYSVAVTTKNGQVFTGYIADRGPHGSLDKLDVSKGMYDAINRNGGAASARLVDGSGRTITSF